MRFRVEIDLQKNLSIQKIENVKLQNQISAIKQEKTLLQQNLIGLQRRIGELELSIGGDHPNAEWIQDCELLIWGPTRGDSARQ